MKHITLNILRQAGENGLYLYESEIETQEKFTKRFSYTSLYNASQALVYTAVSQMLQPVNYITDFKTIESPFILFSYIYYSIPFSLDIKDERLHNTKHLTLIK